MLRNPVPTGVVIGALSAQRVRLTLSIVASGSGEPVRAITSTPASCTSQLILTPVASMHFRAAAANSGPVPSPVMRVTSCGIVRFGWVIRCLSVFQLNPCLAAESITCLAERQRAGAATAEANLEPDTRSDRGIAAVFLLSDFDGGLSSHCSPKKSAASIFPGL